MQKLNEYPTKKSVNYEFIRAWQIWTTSTAQLTFSSTYGVPAKDPVFMNWYKRMGTTKDVIKLNDYLTTRSVNYEFILRAWQIWKTSNIIALIIELL